MAEAAEQQEQAVDLMELPKAHRTILRSYGKGFSLVQEHDGQWSEVWLTHQQAVDIVTRITREIKPAEVMQ